MPATKVIPKGSASAQDISAFLGGAEQSPALAVYVLFLKRYGGGHVFPNTLVADAPINFEFSDPKWSLQSFRTIKMNAEEHKNYVSMKSWDNTFRPIGAISGGDSLLIGVVPANMGRLYYWTPDDDGMSFRIVQVSDSFEHLLSQMEYYEDQGMTPPWGRMKSIDDAPAVDLDLAV